MTKESRNMEFDGFTEHLGVCFVGHGAGAEPPVFLVLMRAVEERDAAEQSGDWASLI